MKIRGNRLIIFVQGRTPLLLYFGNLAEPRNFKQMRKNLHIGGDYLEVRHQPDGQRRAQIILEGISGIQSKNLKFKQLAKNLHIGCGSVGYGTQANARVPTIIPYNLPLVNPKPHKKRALIGSFPSSFF